jgi:hypothetical protein
MVIQGFLSNLLRREKLSLISYDFLRSLKDQENCFKQIQGWSGLYSNMFMNLESGGKNEWSSSVTLRNICDSGKIHTSPTSIGCPHLGGRLFCFVFFG